MKARPRGERGWWLRRDTEKAYRWEGADADQKFTWSPDLYTVVLWRLCVRQRREIERLREALLCASADCQWIPTRTHPAIYSRYCVGCDALEFCGSLMFDEKGRAIR